MQRVKNIIYYLSLGLFLLPLIVWQDSVYPFVAPKAFWLQIFSVAIFVVWLLALMSNWKFLKPRFSWLGLIVLLFYGAIFISSLVGENFSRSLWSRSERMTGLLIMFHYGILFLVWRSVFSKEQWYKLWQWFVGLGIVAPLIAIVQIFNSKLLFNAGAGRMSSTLGNPIFLAGFATFLFFSALIFYNNTNQKFKYFWLTEVIVSFIVVFATQTRGDIIGLYIGLVFLLFFLVMDSSWKEKIKINLPILLFLLVAPVLLFSLRNFSFVKSVPALNRFIVTPLNATSGGSRLLMWKTAVVGWGQRPVFGWGWENFYDLFNKHYLPEFSGRTEEWHDNAHNVFFNLLATTGVVGLGAYLGVYFYAFYLLFRNYQQKNKNERFFSLVLGSFWLAHFIRNLFVFEEISSYLVFFWLLVGFDFYSNNSIDKICLKKEASPVDLKKYSNFFKLLRDFCEPILRFLFIIAIIFLAYLYLFRFVYLPAKADYYAAQAVKKSMIDFKGAMAMHRQAVKIINPYRPDISLEFGQFILNWLSSHTDFVFSDHRSLAKEMYDFGVGALQSYISDYPNDTRAGRLLGVVYGQGYDFWGDKKYLEGAVKIYEFFLPTSPNRQTLVFGLARAKMLQDKDDEALKIIEQFIGNFPKFPEAYWMKSLIFAHKGDDLSAFNFSKKALELGYKFNSNELLFLFDLFKTNNSVNLLEGSLKDQFNSESPSLRLVEKYINYLNKADRKEEANFLKLKFNR